MMKIKKIVVSAGPTREPIDPIRFLSNRSTGILGFEIAIAARKRRYSVTLVAGPTALTTPSGVKRIDVSTARDMKRVLGDFINKADCIIMTAAVSDFRPARRNKSKLKKGSKKTISLTLLRNPDILAQLARRKKKTILIGCALETEHTVKRALKKLRSKKLDMIIANTCTPGKDPFGKGPTDVVILDRLGKRRSLHNVTKAKIADTLLAMTEEYASSAGAI